MAAQNDANFWKEVDAHLRDRRALMDHDEPNYVSAVTDSAVVLGENISKSLNKYPVISDHMRNYAMLLRDEIKKFLDEIQKVEMRAGITLKGKDIDRWKLAELCRAREGETPNLLPCDAEFEQAHDTWRTKTQVIAQTAARLFGLTPTNFRPY
jgi:hypothetical protein